MSVIQTDVILVGAGPIGLEMAVALKKSGIDYLHFDAKQIGYTISWFPPLTRFFSSTERIAIAGVALQTADQSKATREEYLAYLRSVAMQFDLAVRTYEPVTRIEHEGEVGEGFRVTTAPAAGTQVYKARRLILTIGGTDHPRRLNIPGEDLPHVSHYFREAHEYFRKRVLIVGGRNSAVEAALRCHAAGAQVSLSYRREKLDPTSIKYWLLPEMNGLIEAGRLNAYFGSQPTEITATGVRLAPSGIAAGERLLREPVTLPFDFVLLLTGYEADLTLLKQAGVEIGGPCHAPVFNPETMQTNVPGIYVAGTVVGGTQEKYTIFIENCHIHVARIMASLVGGLAPAGEAQFARPES